MRERRRGSWDGDATRLQAALTVRDGPVPVPSDAFLEVSADARVAMPASVYLENRLKTPASRQTMYRGLDVIAGLLSDDRATRRSSEWALLDCVEARLQGLMLCVEFGDRSAQQMNDRVAPLM
jgi:hypothetical protein